MAEDLPTETTESVDGSYGSFAMRSRSDHRFWNCHESSDYVYKAVVDDFGTLQPVGPIINVRGY